MNHNEILEKLKSWNWQLFFNTAYHLGDQFNEPSWRMMKGEVICTALEICSNGDAKYVDGVGYDLILGQTKIEVKTEKNIIKRDYNTKSIQLKNTRGEIQRFNQNFDYLLIANTSPTYLSALVDWEKVSENHILAGDQILCPLKEDDLSFITDKDGFDLISTDDPHEESLKNYIKGGMKNWIREIN